MRPVILTLWCLGAVLGEAKLQYFIKQLEKHHSFQCSLDVNVFSYSDTLNYIGYFAYKGKRFLLHVGDEFYLRRRADEGVLSWVDGSDAVVDEYLTDFANARGWRTLDEWFSLNEACVGDTCVVAGVAKDTAFVTRFEIRFDRRSGLPFSLSVWGGAGERVEARVFWLSFAPPGDSLFVLPKGKAVVR